MTLLVGRGQLGGCKCPGTPSATRGQDGGWGGAGTAEGRGIGQLEFRSLGVSTPGVAVVAALSGAQNLALRTCDALDGTSELYVLQE